MTSDRLRMTNDRLRMTPGPTRVPERVRERMAEPTPNPDVEEEFFDWYDSLLEKLGVIFGSNDVVVLGGEGILGLEAAVASLVEEGDEVLCISNGIYGDGFADFMEMYGGDPETCSGPYAEGYDLDAIETTLEDGSFEVATMVHCETPTGVLNDLDPVLDLLEAHDVFSVVDAVSSLGGTPVPVDRIDVCIGATQKCFSAPPGLTICSISDRAWERIEEVDAPSFYTNFAPWRTAVEERWFPYTHLTSNLYGLEAAIDLVREEGVASVFERHEEAAMRCRDLATDLGLEPYPDREGLCSPTVTALAVDGRAKELQEAMLEEHGIVLATGIGDLEEEILRIGHMGHNARLELVEETMEALRNVVDG